MSTVPATPYGIASIDVHAHIGKTVANDIGQTVVELLSLIHI